MNRPLAPLALVLALACANPALAAEDISRINGSIETTAGGHYGDLETVNGAVRVAERVQAGAASTVNGSITVGDGARLESLEAVNGSLRLGRDVQVAGGIETVNGSVFVDQGSRIGRGVETVNGAIGLVRTHLGTGIETQLDGGITVSRPQGWFSAAPKRRPRVVISPGAVVAGPLRFEREVDLYVHRSARIGPVTGAEPVIFDTDTAPRD